MTFINRETNKRFAEISKLQQDETRGDFSLLINKLQMAIGKNKTMGDEIISLKKHIDIQAMESGNLQDQIEKFMSENRSLIIENNTLKQRLNSYEPGFNLELLSKQVIDEVKDKEINTLRDRVRTLISELKEM